MIGIVTLTHSSSSLEQPTTATRTAAQTTLIGDAAVAHGELLSVSALPPGWVDTGISGFPQSSFFEGLSLSGVTQLAGCLGVNPASVATDPVGAQSQTFSDPTGSSSVLDAVELFPTADGAAADAEAAAGARISQCPGAVDAVLNLQGPCAGAGDQVPQAGQLVQRAIPSITSNQAVLSVTDPGWDGSSGSVAYFDQVIVQVGRSESILDITSFVGPSPEGLILQVAKVAAAQMRPH
jgi:hypothetical protein